MVPPMHMLPPKMQLLCQTWPYVYCILGTKPTYKPPLTPNPSLKVQLLEFTYYNDIFPQASVTKKTRKYDILHMSLIQHGWMVLPLINITASIRCIVIKTTTIKLLDLKSLNNKVHKVP